MNAPPRLWTTRDLCVELQQKVKGENPARKVDTPYGYAKYVGTDPNTASDWLDGGRVMSDQWAEWHADELGLDRAWVTLCLAVERTKSDELSAEMAAILLRLPNHAASVLLGFVGLSLAFLGQPGIA